MYSTKVNAHIIYCTDTIAYSFIEWVDDIINHNSCWELNTVRNDEKGLLT